MQSSIKNICLALVSVATLASCTGHKNGGAADDSDVDAAISPTSNESGICGRDVLNEYRQVAKDCRFQQSGWDEKRCRQTAESFLQKYPRANCTARDRRGHLSTSVTHNNVETILDSIRSGGHPGDPQDAGRGSNHEGERQYGDGDPADRPGNQSAGGGSSEPLASAKVCAEIMDEESRIQEGVQKLLDALTGTPKPTADRAQVLHDQLNSFQMKYQNLNCGGADGNAANFIQTQRQTLTNLDRILAQNRRN